MKLRLLGNLSPRSFLQRYWQKRPLFVRGALPDFRSAVDLATLSALAAQDDVESRIVVRRGRKWLGTHGPFENKSLLKGPASTLLVSGANLHVRAAAELL